MSSVTCASNFGNSNSTAENDEFVPAAHPPAHSTITQAEAEKVVEVAKSFDKCTKDTAELLNNSTNEMAREISEAGANALEDQQDPKFKHHKKHAEVPKKDNEESNEE